jgi:hypothetical protein
MVEEEECSFVENVGGIDEDPPSIAFTQMQFPSFLDVENVHLQFGNILDVDVSQLVRYKSTSCNLNSSQLYVCMSNEDFLPLTTCGFDENASVVMHNL